MDQTFTKLECSRKHSGEALCSLHAIITLQAIEGSSDSAILTESRVPWFSLVFSGFFRLSSSQPTALAASGNVTVAVAAGSAAGHASTD